MTCGPACHCDPCSVKDRSARFAAFQERARKFCQTGKNAGMPGICPDTSTAPNAPQRSPQAQGATVPAVPAVPAAPAAPQGVLGQVASKAKAAYAAVTAWLDQKTNVPGVQQAKAGITGAMNAAKSAQGKLTAVMQTRYGKVAAGAILTASIASNFAPGVPVWFASVPGSSLLAQLPLMAIAESALQIGRAAHGAARAVGIAHDEGAALTPAETARLGREIKEKVYAAFFATLQPHAGALKATLDRDMLPGDAVQDSTQRGSANAQLGGHRLRPNAPRRTPPDQTEGVPLAKAAHKTFSELGKTVAVASRPTPLAVTVPIIVGNGAKPEMVRIRAGRIVAARTVMQNAQAVRDRAAMNLPRKTVGRNVGASDTASNTDVAIAPLANASPTPAAVLFDDAGQILRNGVDVTPAVKEGTLLAATGAKPDMGSRDGKKLATPFAGNAHVRAGGAAAQPRRISVHEKYPFLCRGRAVSSGAARTCPTRQFTKFSERGNSLAGVEIFPEGVQRGKKYTRADLDDMVANFRRFSNLSDDESHKPHIHVPIFTVPAALGHEEEQQFLQREDLPAAGWAKRLRRITRLDEKGNPLNVLVADFEDIPEEVARLLKSKAYRTVSAEIYDAVPEGLHGGKGKMLRRVAFLGANVPQCKNLKSIPAVDSHSESRPVHTPSVIRFSDTRPGCIGATCCLSEVRPMNTAEMIAQLTEMGMDKDIAATLSDEQLAEMLRWATAPGPDADPNAPDPNAPPAPAPAPVPHAELGPDGKPIPAKNADGTDVTTPASYDEATDRPSDDEKSSPEKMSGYVKRLAEKYGCKMADAPGETPVKTGPTKVITQQKTEHFSEARIGLIVAREVEKALKGNVGKSIAELQKFTEDTKLHAREEEVTKFCELHSTPNSKKEVRLTARDLDPSNPGNIRDLLLKADNTVIDKFGEGATAKPITEYGRLKAMVENRRPEKFAETARTNKAGVAVSGETNGKKERLEAAYEKMSEGLELGGWTRETWLAVMEKAPAAETEKILASV